MNEFDGRKKFYKRFQAEKCIRVMANNENTFHIGLFACCRELDKSPFNFLSLEEVTKILKEQEEEKERQRRENGILIDGII